MKWHFMVQLKWIVFTLFSIQSSKSFKNPASDYCIWHHTDRAIILITVARNIESDNEDASSTVKNVYRDRELLCYELASILEV